MNEPTLNYLSCPDATGGHRMAWWDWGAAGPAHVVVCVHGLSRQGRDFDTLARHLLQTSAQPLRVVSVDVVGRGHSDWLPDPAAYQLPTYVADLAALLALLRQQGATIIDWVGTSMGGLIGMAVAGHPALRESLPIRRLVLNDVGPVIQFQALVRISQYLGRPIHFDNPQQAADYLWSISTGFGPHTPAQWMALCLPMLRPDGEGLRLHYDPAIAQPLRGLDEAAAQAGEAALWQLYDQIQARTLLLRGADSDLLSPQTAQAMTERGPRARLVSFAGVGHAPTLVAPDQLDVLSGFLLGQG